MQVQFCWGSGGEVGYRRQDRVGHTVKMCFSALAGVAQWIGPQPVNQKVSGSVPGGAHAWVTGLVLG